MDAKTYLSILREHSEYICKLATQLTTTLTQIEQAFSEPNGPSSTNPGGSWNEVANLRSCLSAEAHSFCTRLELFLEEMKTGNEATTEIRQTE